MTKRKIVTERITSACFYSILDGKTPQEVIKVMEEYIQSYKGRDVYFDVDGYGYDGGKELDIYERREESDKEFADRRKKEQKEKDNKKILAAQTEAKELAEFQRLSKKFANKV
jgi:hypothetical protein